MNHACAEGDGGNVPLSGGTQTQDKSQGSDRQACLIGMANNRRIEERGGFQRVFGQKVRADQKLSLL